MARKKVAIVGSGCAGLGAAWGLHGSDYDIHVFEKSERLGGHTNTQPWRHGNNTVPVDTGFIVMNTATYPNFIRFLKHVGIEPVQTEMTFGVSRDSGRFEWSGEAQGIFAQRRNLLRLGHWRMIFDIIRFNQFALDMITDEVEDNNGTSSDLPSAANMTIGEYLEKEGYSRGFRDDYLIPMTAAVWSTSPDKASLEFPTRTLIRFMWNHHLLSTVAERPAWLTIPGGSQRYIKAIIDQFTDGRWHVHTSSQVTEVLRPAHQGKGPVTVSWIDARSGKPEHDTFEHVVLACHGDEILPLLTKHVGAKTAPSHQNGSNPLKSKPQYVSDDEIKTFSAFQTTENVTYLHSDLSLMPKRRKVWTSWNYLINSSPSTGSQPAGVSLTYCMNILQHLSEDMFGPVLVTMNPGHEPDPKLTQGKFVYRHPLYTIEAVQAQKRLELLQNKRGVSFCGAWTKYGFHEDGFSSGLRVAVEHLNAEVPFQFIDSTFSRGHRPELGWRDYLLRAFILFVLMGIRFAELILSLPLVRSVFGLINHAAGRALDAGEHFGFL